MLISSLKLLATRGARGEDSAVICLAIEEPELYQHPTQARAFASVLRGLSKTGSAGLQITYATHSPYFVDARYFDQIRRVDRSDADEDGNPLVRVTHATLQAVAEKLDGYIKATAVTSRWDQVCTKNLAEAFFAHAVLLVEGDDDRAILEGAAARVRHFAVDGVCVAPSSGKGGLFLPHAILDSLGIPVVVVFDNDAGMRDRMTANGKGAETIAAAVAKDRELNRSLLRYFGAEEVDLPEGVISDRLVAVPDTLETLLLAEWPAWTSTRSGLVKDGRGADGKHAGTYGLAAEECVVDPVGLIPEIIATIRGRS